MRRIVADSLDWIALSHQRDQWHVAALQFSQALQHTEIVTRLSKLSRKGHHVAAGGSVTGSDSCSCIGVGGDIRFLIFETMISTDVRLFHQ